MNNLLFGFLAMIIGGLSILVLGLTKEYNAMVFEYEQDARVQHEYWKACDAVRMYQENLLDQNGIESAVK